MDVFFLLRCWSGDDKMLDAESCSSLNAAHDGESLTLDTREGTAVLIDL